MKRRYEGGASKKRRKLAREEVERKLVPITSFMKTKESIHPDLEPKTTEMAVSPGPEECETVKDRPSTSKILAAKERKQHDPGFYYEQECETAKDSPSTSKIVAAKEEKQHDQGFYYEQEHEPDSDSSMSPERQNILTQFDPIDIAVLDVNRTSDMQMFLKISKFDFPNDISVDRDNHAFPTRLLTKQLPNGEKCIRDWLCWSAQKTSLFCAPCFLFNKGEANAILSSKSGWDIKRGWRKLKDRIPQHENSSKHKESYIAWKTAQKAALGDASIGNLLLKEISTEANKWEKILERILDVILFLSERGLGLFGSSKRIGDRNNGNFLGLIELLSKYDSLLSEHVKRVRESQSKGTRMQVHYLSSSIQNEFIEICGSAVQKEIIEEIRSAKYFAIIADSTPDYAHMEQTTLLVRYIKMLEKDESGNASFSIEERFLLFESFTEKTGKEIAGRLLEILERLGLDFENCTGQAYDNGSNMAGLYNGVQAILLGKNSNCIFSSCGNHTLNLVGVDSAESCNEAVTYFGVIQQIYNIFSSSPKRWEILKKHVPVSLHGLATTRWSARIEAAKPVAHHTASIINAVNDLKHLNLTSQTRTEIDGILKYLSSFEGLLLSAVWVKILTMIHETNLVIEARNATLDVEKDNLDSLINDIKQIRESWNAILSEARLVAQNIGIACEFKTSRKLPTQADAEKYYRKDVFYVIVDAIVAGLNRRFSSLQEICLFFSFLWKFNDLSSDDINSLTKTFQEKYRTEISSDITEELLFLKIIYSTNFTSASNITSDARIDARVNPKELLTKVLNLGLSGVFPNVVIALRIFLTLPASVASGERSFSALKQVKNYNRATMGQERSSGLAMLYINNDIARLLNYSTIIANFANIKARKAFIAKQY